MKPLDTLKAGAAGFAEKVTGEHPKLFQEVIKLVQSMPDGVAGLMKQFQERGLGPLAASLSGKGPKKPITPEEITKGFGADKIKALASSAGLEVKQVPEKLANLLPKVIDQLSSIKEKVTK
jgi:uncharacterized protein YidB (DUF937 family)